MKKGCEISAQAHKAAMQFVAPNMNEQSLEAFYLYKFAEQGSRFPAYTPIVAGGEHACILHYVENDQILNDGDLVLVDAGGEYECYASDITRTYPVNGKFNDEQLAVIRLFWRLTNKPLRRSKQGIILCTLKKFLNKLLLRDWLIWAYLMEKPKIYWKKVLTKTSTCIKLAIG